MIIILSFIFVKFYMPWPSYCQPTYLIYFTLSLADYFNHKLTRDPSGGPIEDCNHNFIKIITLPHPLYPLKKTGDLTQGMVKIPATEPGNLIIAGRHS